MTIGFVFLLQSSPVCNGEVSFMDVNTGKTITLNDTDLTIAETNITFTTQQLGENRRYNVTVTASNSCGQAISYTMISMCIIE